MYRKFLDVIDLALRERNAFAVTIILFFSSRRRHTIFDCDWSSDVCSSDLARGDAEEVHGGRLVRDGVEGGRELGLGEPRKAGELAVDALLGLRGPLVDRVDLGAVARREDDCLRAAGGEALERSAPEIRVVGEQLTELHRSALVRGADEDEPHQKCAKGVSTRRTRTTSRKPVSAR